ncbi:phage antirepressor KilAC domain-containing protein [Clostridium chromiireducens]|uniref:Phage antirepressor protein KilAC domain protein n=1 Tax=Clostridium chromiireducens TaxID=225345 RepID=A0A1V4IF96_9CLOT|nr:phage antirepressor KilAC domain-containing protein [Clostridium chromiireducens]OPJ58524.1 phage antirepressor protein KilAC domain protein [Clostridium chromiireducens]
MSQNVNNIILRESLTIDTRDISDFTGVPHYAVLRKLDGAKNKDGTTKFNGIVEVLRDERISVEKYFVESIYVDAKGEKRKCYLCTRLGCDLLANKFNGQKGIIFTAKYVDMFYKMEKALRQNKYSYLIDDPIERAKRWITEEEERKGLRSEVSKSRAKVIFADAVCNSNSTILVNELAKILKQNGINIGGLRLFDYLRENGYLVKRKGSEYNLPTQKSMDLKLFQIKETIINHGDGKVIVSKTTKITGKGQKYFINKFIGKNYDGC